jgi:hypothetical protein
MGELLFIRLNIGTGISGTGIIFLKTLGAVISSREVSEGSVVLRALNEGSAEIGKTF